MINVRSSFKNGDITFTWNVSTNEPPTTIHIEYNNGWTELHETRHTVKNVFLYEQIFIDVRNLGGFYRWNYTGICYTLFILIQVGKHVHDQSLIEIA